MQRLRRSIPSDGPVVLIAGGQGKGGDFDRLARETSGHLRAAVLIGEDADELESAFQDLTPTERANNMYAAVSRAAELAENGDTVLLAPACASFDQFDNYQARGEEFVNAVEDARDMTAKSASMPFPGNASQRRSGSTGLCSPSRLRCCSAA